MAYRPIFRRVYYLYNAFIPSNIKIFKYRNNFT